MANLFRVGNDLMALNDLEDELGGEISPDVEAAWLALRTELDANQAAKLDDIAAWINQLDMEAVAAKAQVDQWAKRVQVRQNRIVRIKIMVKDHLEATKQKSALGASGVKFRISGNGGRFPVKMAETIDMSKVPDEFVKIRREVDGEAVYAHLIKLKEDTEANPDNPPPSLGFATLQPRGTHIRITV